ncbi:Endonuclease/exonuclease/phosphatase [Thelephora terrestris]|uniref:Endonuclease/exonuclease/phosphatase n=1 Tax=Thelephora terrestris TaxID=56493 RepID=A0A9P6H7H5_9AGAM|nr:Endonuclease/exonuclease/phosphatase [Thelephora terrestris]
MAHPPKASADRSHWPSSKRRLTRFSRAPMKVPGDCPLCEFLRKPVPVTLEHGYNLRYDCKPDQIAVKDSIARLPDPSLQPSYLSLAGKEQPWSSRRIRIAQDLLRECVALAGFQEALVRQVNDMQELLGDDWAWVGQGRDDGASRGEFNSIFYKKSVFKLIDSDTFWLSPTPFRCSVYPGAGCIRICTTARLLSRTSSQRLTLINTHLDHLSDDQRKYGASLLLVRGRFEAATSNGPVILTGDFNSSPTGDDSGAYGVITGKVPPMQVAKEFTDKFNPGPNELPDFKFLDTRVETPKLGVSGNFATFTGWSPTRTAEWGRIDFAFGGNNGRWKSTAYKVGAGMSDDGMMHSDHRPVFVDLTV